MTPFIGPVESLNWWVGLNEENRGVRTHHILNLLQSAAASPAPALNGVNIYIGNLRLRVSSLDLRFYSVY